MSELVPITLPSGEAATVPKADLAQALAAGATTRGGETQSTSSEESGGLLGQAAAAVLGAGSTATFGLTDKLAREIPYIIGGEPAAREVTSQLRMVRERNPYSTMAGEFGGLLVNPEAISGAGEAAAAPIAARVGEGLLGKAATSAVRVGFESSLLGAQHEITEESLGNHDLNAQAIWTEAGKEGLLGAGLGFTGGLLWHGSGLGKVSESILSKRPGPMSAATLDELAGGVEGAGAGVRDHAARAEKMIEDLRATGATTDQAVDMVKGLDDAAKARGHTASEGKGLVDWANEQIAAAHEAKNPERAQLIRDYYAKAVKGIETGMSDVDRTALEMSKRGTSVLRNIDDIANEAQFTMKPERFAKLVNPENAAGQVDAVNSFLQDTDRMLSFWESTADAGGMSGAIKKLRRQHTDMSDAVYNMVNSGGGPEMSRDLFIRFNRFKQALDGYIPYGRLPGTVIEGKAAFFGLPEAVLGTRNLETGVYEDGILPLANRARGLLEDEAIWGEAGAAQARENKTFSDMLPRFQDFKSTYGANIDQAQGVRIPEIDFAKTRSVLDSISGNAEVDEALQPIKSARATIDGMRARIAALREGGELTESQMSKLARGESDLAAFEASLNGAMKEAAKVNRVKAAVLEEGHSGMGGLLGAALDVVNRPMATAKRLGEIQHTVNKVLGGVKELLGDFAAKAKVSSTDGVAARDVTPRTSADIIKDVERVREIARNPAQLEMAANRMVGDLSRYAPKTADALRLTAMRYLLYLAQTSPVPSVSSTSGFGGTPTPRYSDIALHEWEGKRIAGADARDLLVDMRHGKLDRDSIEAARYVAPEMFRELQSLAQEQLDKAKARGELDHWPYQQQALMASLLDVHADDTFKPDFMLAMKAARAMPEPSQQQTTPPPKRGPSGPVAPPQWLQTQAQMIEGGM